jgi:hypothetical protein
LLTSWQAAAPFVQPIEEIQNDLAAAVVIDHFTPWACKGVLLAAALCVGDRFDAVSEKLEPGPWEESNHAQAHKTRESRHEHCSTRAHTPHKRLSDSNTLLTGSEERSDKGNSPDAILSKEIKGRRRHPHRGLKMRKEGIRIDVLAIRDIMSPLKQSLPFGLRVKISVCSTVVGISYHKGLRTMNSGRRSHHHSAYTEDSLFLEGLQSALNPKLLVLLVLLVYNIACQSTVH